MRCHSLYLTRNKTKNPIAHVLRGQVARVWHGTSSPGEVQSSVTCKCHVRNAARCLQHFSSVGPIPRLLYEILEFLTIGNKLVFLYTMQAKEATWTHLGTKSGSLLLIFSVSSYLASSLSPSRSSPWCLASKRAQPALAQVCMVAGSWALGQPQNLHHQGRGVHTGVDATQQPSRGTGVPMKRVDPTSGCTMTTS